MSDETTTVINIHPSAFEALSEANDRNVRSVWLHAASKLRPGKGAQVVDLSDATRSERKAVAELVELGLLKRHKQSACKFYVPRGKAFASIEPSWQALSERVWLAPEEAAARRNATPTVDL